MIDRDCKHGQLARSCERCDDARDIASLRARVEELERERQHYVDAHASVKGGLVEVRKQRDDAYAAVRQHEVSIASLERVRDRLAPVRRALDVVRDFVAAYKDGNDPFEVGVVDRARALLGEE